MKFKRTDFVPTQQNGYSPALPVNSEKKEKKQHVRNVRLSVCLSVCVCVCSLLRYRLTVFLPPLPEVGCLIFLEIRNPWGKVMEISGIRFNFFFLEVV